MSVVPKLDIDQLVIEITRRCNMACPHCLRGDAGDADLSLDLLGELLDQVCHVTEVTFTGGEPSLAVPLMERAWDMLRERGIIPSGFFIATNGKRNQAGLALFALRCYRDCDDKPACAVALSDDPYHEGVEDGLVRGLACYSDSKERTGDGAWTIPAGRALEYDIGDGNPRRIQARFGPAMDDEGTVRVPTLYLSCNGMCFPECDLSYREMDDALDSPDDCPTEAVPVRGCAGRLAAMAREGA